MLQIIIIILTLIDFSFSQGHVKYRDASGTKVDWKIYAPYSQFGSSSDKSTFKQSEIMKPAMIENPVIISDDDTNKNMSPRYKPFSQIPNQLKQLLLQSYEPQKPYVNPDSFLLGISKFGQVIPRKTEPMMEKKSRIQTTVIKAEDYRREKQQQQYTENNRMKEEISSSIANEQQQLSLNFDKSVPLEIQQILNYQAQMPYDIAANRIFYKPAVIPFVPEPFLEDETGPYKYRSRIYYAVKNNDTRNKKIEEYSVAAAASDNPRNN